MSRRMKPLTGLDDVTLSDGYRRLTTETESAGQPQVARPTELHLSEILTAKAVFQPRSSAGKEAESKRHVEVLVDAIRSEASKRLDPILVWWSGAAWRVIDGHHRLAAYHAVTSASGKRAITIDQVPVTVFTGTLDDAIAEATRCNAKDKLPMSKHDKLEQAWKLTILGTFTIPAISQFTTVSERTVSNMRAELAELKNDWQLAEAKAGKPDSGTFGVEGFLSKFADPLSVTWKEVKAYRSGKANHDDDWVERQAREWADRLAKTFGSKFGAQPDIAALSLQYYSDKLPDKLKEAWDGAGYESDEAGDDGG